MSLFLAAVMIAFGVPLTVWPYEMTKFEQILNELQYGESQSNVERDDRNVALNRVVGVLSIGIGVVALFL